LSSAAQAQSKIKILEKVRPLVNGSKC